MSRIYETQLPAVLVQEVKRMLDSGDERLIEAAGFMPYIAKLTANFDNELDQAYFVEDIIKQVKEIEADDRSDCLMKIKQIIDSVASSEAWQGQGEDSHGADAITTVMPSS